LIIAGTERMRFNMQRRPATGQLQDSAICITVIVSVYFRFIE